MAKELIYIDAAGDKQAVDLGVGMYEAAAQANQSLPQYLATAYPTNADKHGSVYEQLLEQCGQRRREEQLVVTELEVVVLVTLDDLVAAAASTSVIRSP